MVEKIPMNRLLASLSTFVQRPYDHNIGEKLFIAFVKENRNPFQVVFQNINECITETQNLSRNILHGKQPIELCSFFLLPSLSDIEIH